MHFSHNITKGIKNVVKGGMFCLRGYCVCRVVHLLMQIFVYSITLSRTEGEINKQTNITKTKVIMFNFPVFKQPILSASTVIAIQFNTNAKNRYNTKKPWVFGGFFFCLFVFVGFFTLYLHECRNYCGAVVLRPSSISLARFT